MKILLFSLDYLPSSGGIARMMSSIKDELIKKSFEVTVLTGQKSRVSKEQGVIRVKSLRVISEILCLVKLVKITDHIILCARWYPEGLIAFLGGKKYSVFTHSAELLPTGNVFYDFFREPLKTLVLKRAVRVISNSHFTNDLVNSSKNKVTIPLGVNPDQFYPVSKEDSRKHFGITQRYVLLTVARIEEHKGHERVFKIIAKLPKEIRKDLVYLIAGKGSFRETLAKKVEEYKIGANIDWLGFIPEENLNMLYSTADVFLLLSSEEKNLRKVEGFGLTLVEAQACGIPVIGSDQGGIPDAIKHCAGGFISNTDNLDEIVQHLTFLLSDSVYRDDQSAKARLMVCDYYNWNRYCNELIRIIR